MILRLMLLSSLLAVVYVWRVVEVAYFAEPDAAAANLREAPAAMLIPTWVAIGATIVFGLSTSLTAGVARTAAEALLGVGP